MGIKYDPMTGKPLEDSVMNSNVKKYDPLTGKPLYKKNKRKIWIIVVCAIVLVLLVIGIITGTLFANASNRVLWAFTNTIKEDSVYKNSKDILNIINSDELSVALNVYFSNDYNEKYTFNSKYSKDSSAKQLSFTMDSPYDDNDISFITKLNSSKLEIQFDNLLSCNYVYDYRNDKYGYITEIFAEEEIKAFDNMLETIYGLKDDDLSSEEFLDIILGAYNSLEFDTISKKKIEIDGKTRKCKGYSTIITPEHILDVLMEIETTKPNSLLNTYIEAFAANIDDKENIELEIYVYGGKLACIIIDSMYSEVEIQFHGGTTRTQNLEIKIHDYVEHETLVIKKEVKIQKAKTITNLTFGDSQDSIQFIYDKKSGDFELITEDGYIKYVGNIEQDKNQIIIYIDDIWQYGEVLADCRSNIIIKRGAEFVEMNDNKVNIVNASESEMDTLEDYIFPIFDFFEDLSLVFS